MALSLGGRNADVPGVGGATLPSMGNMPTLGDFPAAPRSGQIRDLQGRFAGGFASAWMGFSAMESLGRRLQDDMRHKASSALEALQSEMVSYAQDNAPWSDVTGDARALLNSPPIVQQANGDSVLILAHGVDYGVYLETDNGGVFGIIPKTIQEFASRVPEAMRSAP